MRYRACRLTKVKARRACRRSCPNGDRFGVSLLRRDYFPKQAHIGESLVVRQHGNDHLVSEKRTATIRPAHVTIRRSAQEPVGPDM
jgi:hypothetical protein